MVGSLKEKAAVVKRDTYAVYLASRHPETPWYAKALAVAIVAYALSPIDLIPDFIPVLGYLDDLVLLPLGIVLVVKMVPAPVMADCRLRAQEVVDRPTSRWAGPAIVAIWALLALLFVSVLLRLLG